MRMNLLNAPLLGCVLTALVMLADVSARAQTTAPEAPIAPRTFTLLREGKPVTVVYFGGSITAGAGASNGEKTSYRGLTTAWLKEQFPKATIKAVNAAIGGTGSDLGAFRCQRDVLVHKPDLVFVEFAVNDGGGAEVRVKEAMEGLVRQILKAKAETEIVFIYTTTKALYAPYEKGELPKAVKYDSEVAAHYGIPAINVGKVLFDRVQSEKAEWETYLKDGVHPNDAGYAIYFEAIKAALSKSVTAPLAPTEPKALPKPMTEHPMESARIADASEAQGGDAWVTKDPVLTRYFGKGLACGTPGSELTLKFSGTTVGIFWVMAADSGDIEWSIDGSAPKTRSSWDKYCLKFNRQGYTILANNLPQGEHTLTIKVLETKNKESTGTMIRIGSFLLN